MHGEIRLTSELGQGTTTTFWIPFNKPHSAKHASPLVDAGPAPEIFRSRASVLECVSESQSVAGDLQDIITPAHLDRRTSSGIESILPEEDMDDDLIEQEIDRENVHVLIVEDKYDLIPFRRVRFILVIEIADILLISAINQQIALRTVRKFGFSVNAVWNGREALEYLLEDPSPTHPKPDIILMDCQMPVLDGYRATHLIRHHSPYSTVASIRSLPIIAMTASAIQGDKEKCTQAGMVCVFCGSF